MLTLKQLAEQIGAKYIGDDQPVSGTAFDSRMVNKGDLFVAIKGNVHDGHDFIDRVSTKHPTRLYLPTIMSHSKNGLHSTNV